MLLADFLLQARRPEFHKDWAAAQGAAHSWPRSMERGSHVGATSLLLCERRLRDDDISRSVLRALLLRCEICRQRLSARKTKRRLARGRHRHLMTSGTGDL